METIEIRHYIGLVARWLWLIVLSMVLAAGGAYLYSSAQPPTYTATVTLLIDNSSTGSSQVTDYNAILTSERLARTYSQLLKSPTVLDEVMANLSLDMDTGALASLIDVELVRDTQLIRVTVTTLDPVLSALVANEIPTVFARQNAALQSSNYDAIRQRLSGELDEASAEIQQLQLDLANLPDEDSSETQFRRIQLETELEQIQQVYAALLQSLEGINLTEAQSGNNVIIYDSARAPEMPSGPRTMLNTLIGLFIGAVLALGVVLLIDFLDDRVHSKEQLQAAVSAPVLGQIFRVADTNEKANGPIAAADPSAPVAEAFRSLRTNVQFASVDREIRTLLITSARPSEGKSTIATNLAVVLANAGLRVILIDGDMRNPSIHKLNRLPNKTGLTNLLINDAISLDAALQDGATSNMSLITAGPIPPNPSELLSSMKMQRLLERLTGICDIIIVDTPPVLAVTDPVVLAPKVDAAILVVDSTKTRIAEAVTAAEQLRQVGANLAGLVINKVPQKTRGYGYGYGYYYRYGPEEQRSRNPLRRLLPGRNARRRRRSSSRSTAE